MSLRSEQMVFTKHMVLLLQKAWELGYEVTMGEVARPPEMQQIYVKTGRSKTLRSNHLSRCAVDLNLFLAGKLCTREQIKPLGDWWESIDPKNRWGGNWRGLVDSGKSSFIDAPHFERNVS